MNYFQLFNIPESLNVDKALLKKRFYQLSKQYHPDFFVNDDNASQTAALEKSAMLNKAFKTLNDSDLLLFYFLTEKGIITEGEKHSLSNAFLMEVMDLNEQLMEADDAEGKQAVISTIEQLKSSIYEPVETYLEAAEANNFTEKALLQLKEYYYQKKYLDKILAEL